MEILIIDISGKVLNYDYSLCEALAGEVDDDTQIVLAAHVHDKQKYRGKRLKLFSLVPSSQQSSSGKAKRVVKAFEGLINYTILLIYVLINRPAVIHFQWFPFLEFSSVEVPYVRLLKCLLPKTKIVQTIHNVFPHAMMGQEAKREKYRNRMMGMDKGIDHNIVHTESTANEVERLFNIDKNRITVIPHGIFKPNYELGQHEFIAENEKKTIIFYGVNRRNKGADILIDAVRQLPDEYKKQVRVLIAGKTSKEYLKELQAKVGDADVTFRPTFIPNNDLYEMIENADYIALPYREISQSGVLLLAMYFRKPLVISDLPSFRETLKGFTPDMFFETENAESMSELIKRMLGGGIDTQKELRVIESLNEEYSWENSASKTVAIYKQLTC